jgi:saccharopine dehydrogenase-like NADP-dependent oxidoreductase
MKKILLFGAGKSASVLIRYLLQQCAQNGWQLAVADANPQLAESKIKGHPNGVALSFDIHDAAKRRFYVTDADITISLLPPLLHILVAKDCLAAGKNLLTASYIDPEMEALRSDIEQKGLLFLCEMGLDPGIDHMSAVKLINDIKGLGGNITRFYSHCGGLLAPQSPDNPWQYKISWNPRNVVHAGKDGAVFLKDGREERWEYEQLFADKRNIQVQDATYCWYPNRNSLPYLKLYGLESCRDFVRTTLRHPDFIYGWKNLIDLKWTSTDVQYNTDGKSLENLFKEHLEKHNFSTWLEEKLKSQLEGTQELLTSLMNLVELEAEAASEDEKIPDDLMLVDERGDLKEIDLEDLKYNAAATLALRMHESKLTLQQLFYLGMNDAATILNRGNCSAADILQFALEQKLALQPGDRDMVVMQHQITYELNGKTYCVESSLVLEGKDDVQTAMSTTVGLPLGIAAVMILKGELNVTGLHIPILPEIYNPVLAALEKSGIRFTETEKEQ